MSVNPPRPKGPSLNALRAFEAAGRHQSFVLAADELSVSPGAVSQHIKTLEAWSGVTLFQRNAQGVELTRAGLSVIQRFTVAFDALSDAAHDLRNLSTQIEIHIAALPAVAQLWLPSRLGKIRQAFPDIRFFVTAMETPPNLTREMYDIRLFIGEHCADNADERAIVPDEIVPVCAPSLAERITKPGHLNTVPLLQDQTWSNDWVQWSNLTGEHLDDATSGPGYSLYSLAVEEAKSGAGALMGHRMLIERALAEETLVSVYPKMVPTGRALILGMRHRSRRRREVDDVANVLME